MGISVETDVIKRLDDVRKQNNLASLEDLEKAVEGVRDGLGRLQDADAQQPADPGSDSPGSGLAHGYRQRRSEEILRRAQSRNSCGPSKWCWRKFS